MKRAFSLAAVCVLFASHLCSGVSGQSCYRSRACYVAPAYVAPVKYVVQREIFYTVGIDVRSEAIAEKAALKAVEMFKQQQQLNLGASGRVCIDFNTAGAASGTSGGPSVPSLPPAPAGDHSAAQAVFNESCVSCHSGATAKGNLDLSDLSKLPAAKLQKAALRAYTGSMPPQPAQPIGQEKADALLKWAEGLPSQ